MILTYKSLSIQMKIFIEESLLSGLSGQLPEVLAYTISGSDSLASRCVSCIKVCILNRVPMYICQLPADISKKVKRHLLTNIST